MMSSIPMIELIDVSKTFTLHLQHGTVLNVISNVSFQANAGECIVLGGPSGAGKSSILKILYGNYRCDEGSVLVRSNEKHVDIAKASPQEVLKLRRNTIGYVSQFLRVIPRVSTLDIVATAGTDSGLAQEEATSRAQELLTLLNVPKRLWGLPPATFSGGEQQRVNIARGMIDNKPILLLDEPTASLDAKNRAVVVELIRQKLAVGTTIIGIFHDEDVRDAVATRIVDVARFGAQAA